MKALTCGLTILVCASAAIAAPVSSLRASLIVPNAKPLPGVSFDMWIDVENPTDLTQSVGTASRRIVTPAAAPPFTIDPALKGSSGPPLLRGRDGEVLPFVEIKPHHTQTLTLPLDERLAGSVFAADPRLTKPGRYQIAIVLDSYSRTRAPLEFSGPVTTNEVTLDRIEPMGADAEVWALMQATAGSEWNPTMWNAWTAATLRREILRNYAESAYTPYAVLATVSNDQASVTRLLNAIDRFPETPVVELLYLEAWHRPNGFATQAAYERVTAIVKAVKRPTTRILAFGREDLGPPPCPPDYDCTD